MKTLAFWVFSMFLQKDLFEWLTLRRFSIFILRHYKTRGRVFTNEGRMMRSTKDSKLLDEGFVNHRDLN